MIRSYRTLFLALVCIGMTWTFVILFSGYGSTNYVRKGLSGGNTSTNNAEFTDAFVTAINTINAVGDVDGIPDGTSPHNVKVLARHLTGTQMTEFASSVKREDPAIEDAELNRAADGQLRNGEEEINQIELEVRPLITKNDAEDHETTTQKVSEDAKNQKSNVLYGFFDEDAYSGHSRMEREYIIKTFLRAWYARKYYPIILKKKKTSGHHRSAEIGLIKDAKARKITERLAALSVVGGGMLIDVSILTEMSPQNPQTIEEGAKDMEILLNYSRTGFMFAQQQGDQLDSLIDRILIGDSDVVDIVRSADLEFYKVDLDAVKKVKAAVKMATDQRRISCANAPKDFVNLVNKESQCIENLDGEDYSRADVIFVNMERPDESIPGAYNDSEQSERLLRELEGKLLAPDNDFGKALTIIEYGFGIFLDRDLSGHKDGNAKVDVPKIDDPNDGGSFADWARGQIDKKWEEILELERQVLEL